MPVSDIRNWVHGKGVTGAAGLAIGRSGSEYSEDQLNAGSTYFGAGKAGVVEGLHMLITESFNTLTYGDIMIVHGAAENPTTVLTGRTGILLAALTAGKHFFVPIPAGVDVLQYLRARFIVTGSNPTTGKVNMWFGPLDGSENA